MINKKDIIVPAFLILVLSVVELAILIPIGLLYKVSINSNLSNFESMLYYDSFLDGNFESLTYICVFSVVLNLFFGLVSQYVYQNTIWSFHKKTVIKLYESIIKDLRWDYIKKNLSNLKKLTLTEAQNVAFYFVAPLVNVIARVLFLITILIFLLYFNLIVIDIEVFGYLSISLIVLIVIYMFFKRIGNERETSASGIFESVDEGFHNVQTIQSLQKYSFFKDRLRNHISKFKLVSNLHGLVPQIPKYIIESILYSIFIYLSIMLFKDSETVNENLIYYILAGLKLAPVINILIKNISDLAFGYKAYKVVRDHFTEYENLNAAVVNSNINSSELDIFQVKNDKYLFKLNLEQKGLILIKGESGCGKSTLLSEILTGVHKFYKVINTLDKSNAGSFLLSDNVGFLPQENYLINDTVFNNITFLNMNLNEKSVSELLKLFKLESLQLDLELNTYGHGVSGGQKQRLNLARLVVNELSVLFLDEPTSALDAENALQFKKIVKQLIDDGEILIVMVTHSDLFDDIAKEKILMERK